MQLRQQILESFVDAVRPARDEITMFRTPDCDEISDYFSGAHQIGLPAETLRRYSAALSVFTPRAFRYWLPAFMLAEIDDPEEADVIAENLAFDFGQASSRRERIQEFTNAELECIAAFFDECLARYDSHWSYQIAAYAVRSALRDADR